MRSRDAAEAAGGAIATRGELGEFFGDDELAERVSRFADFALVADNPVAAARRAVESGPGIAASPVHRLGFHWHQLYSAIQPQDRTGFEFPEVASGDPGRIVAVVDTGIVNPGSLPGWMSSSVVHSPGDREELTDGSISHGTFVASLLRQIAPTHTVSMARADAFEDEPQGATHPEPYPTTEFHVAGAIDRLIERHRGRCRIDALHLAVGGPTADEQETVTLRTAIDRWREHFPDVPIFAAAGNSHHEERIFPAAFRHVRGVSAAAEGGEQIVWDDDGNEISPPDRDWVDDLAPGSNLIGLGGREPAHAASWSGSSFATAVATASYLNGGPVEVRAGIAHWPNRIVRYGDVPGLHFDST
ncbi:MAG: S8/S53 family peptidase [Actinomycetota bacterium]